MTNNNKCRKTDGLDLVTMMLLRSDMADDTGRRQCRH
jgi:hypothetical protein